MELRVQMKGICKNFCKVKANDSVDFDLRKGEIHALLGENGAGKTTLMRVLYGLTEPDGGQILLNGQEVKVDSPNTAIRHGIGMIHQHFMLIPEFTVAENIATGLRGKHCWDLDLTAVEERIRALSKEYGMPLDPRAKVGDLPVGLQQRVEIIKTLYRGTDVLIMDEPTAVLIPQEVDEFFEVLRGLTKKGTSVILISHKLHELMQISDRVTIMRNGRTTGTVQTDAVTQNELARLMVGREVLLKYEKTARCSAETAMVLRGLRHRDSCGVERLGGIDLRVGAGEIVGIAGVEGNGQTQLAEVIAGLLAAEGSVCLNGQELMGLPPSARCHAGLSYIPENRQTTGLVLKMPIQSNLVLKSLRDAPYYARLRLRHRIIRARSAELVEQYHIKIDELGDPVSSLSGGNQQKVVIARELSLNPKVLVVAQPTRGLDVGAIEFVHKTLLAKREKGLGMLLISSELEEVLELSDRVVVMYEGRLVGEFHPGEISIEEIGLLMSGAKERPMMEKEEIPCKH